MIYSPLRVSLESLQAGIVENRARVTLVYPQVWSAEGTRNKPSVSHEAHPTDRSWTGKNVGVQIKRALKPVHDVTDGSDRDCKLCDD